MQVQEHPRREEPLQLLSRRRADPLDHAAALSDHDGLLRLALDDNRAVEPQHAVRAQGLLEEIDDDGARERQLGVREGQQLLADDLGRHEALGPVRQVVGRVNRLPFRQPFDQRPLQTVDVVAGGGRHRNDLGETVSLGKRINERQQPRLLDQVDLVQDEEDRRIDRLDEPAHILRAVLVDVARHARERVEHDQVAWPVDQPEQLVGV